MWSVLEVRAAVDDTVGTMEGGGDGIEGDAEIVVKVVALAADIVDAFVAFLVGRVRVDLQFQGSSHKSLHLRSWCPCEDGRPQ